MTEATHKRIPVLVVSGFLGSGKTSLVRHLLLQAQAHGSKAAVITNEFGALGIDRAVLGEAEEAYVELEGGCVCCQLSDTLRDTLQLLWERLQPDQVIVETSGVALPSDTQLQFWREPVSTWVEDDMSVVVVNAEQLLEGRDLRGTFEDQVSSADLLLLNKIDLVPQEAYRQIEHLLRDMALDTPTVRTVHGQVDPAILFPPELEDHRTQRRTQGALPSSHQHESFVAHELTVEDAIDSEVLMARLQALNALRAKGFVRTSQGLRLVQGVGRRLELTGPLSPPPASLIGRIVVISRAAAPDDGHTG
ncbi:Zinc-binding GTPase YeiR [Candidatus Entotheonellaceae bacterium PAL068K]